MEAEESHTRGNCFHNGQSFERSHHRNWPFVSDCFNSNSRCFDLSLFNIRRDCCWWDIHRLNIQRLCRRRCFQKNSNSLDVVASDRRSSNWRGWIPCSACFGGGVRYDRFPSVRTACYRSGDRPVNSKGYDVVYISRLWNFGRSPCPAFDPRRISWSNRGSDYSDWESSALGSGKHGGCSRRNDALSIYWGNLLSLTYSRRQCTTSAFSWRTLCGVCDCVHHEKIHYGLKGRTKRCSR